MKPVLSAEALEHMHAIAAHIARDKPRAADRWLDKLRTFINSIARFPSRGRLLDMDEDGEVRQVLFGNYRVIYELSRKKILVLAIQHGAVLINPEEAERSQGEEE